jgi:hypothetical protein
LIGNREPPAASRGTGSSERAVLAAALVCALAYVFVYATGRANPPIRSDGYSYYVYLPAWFIYGDPSLTAVARDCCGGEFPAFTAIIRWPATRRWVNAHPIGVAILQTPFFLAAHALTKWSNLSADGFTLYYQHAAGLSGTFWTIAGLILLRRLLLRRFTDRVTAATLLALLGGTGLLHYATYDSSYSHAYSFFLLAALLNITEDWWRGPSPGRSLLLGLTAGLIVLTRHTNVLLLAVVPLAGVAELGGVSAAAAAARQRVAAIAAACATAVLVVVPQLVIYEAATGRFLVSSYGELGFNFASPQLWGVLFSVQKGLFFWSPLLLFAVAGFFLRRAETRTFALATALVGGADAYLIASWWDWQFGASYGHRGFVDLLPLFAIGLAGFFDWSAERPLRAAGAGAIATLLVALSVFQMLQYWNGVMPMADLTWEQYRSVFLKLR